ncbi:eukaryotic initiation factor 4A-13-like [Camellia sinensis]|uniref:eukaryotic initiation factor 4A-13-like n=1 Tax=Camellia sinensis TaxID=4442 RepID=UPI001036240C|nr:eukaryotic initiation factor 4A-13-like [Camellia sinensis]
MAGLAPEGSQFDARQYDAKMSDLLGTTYGEEFFTSYDEVYDSFDAMGLQENLLRGIYAYGFEKPSAIQQRGIVPFCKGLDVIQQAQSGTGKTATFCSGILQQLDYGIVECQALVLAPTRELAQQIEKVMRALGDYLHVLQALLQISIHSSLKIKNNTVLSLSLSLSLLKDIHQGDHFPTPYPPPFAHTHTLFYFLNQSPPNKPDRLLITKPLAAHVWPL